MAKCMAVELSLQDTRRLNSFLLSKISEVVVGATVKSVLGTKIQRLEHLPGRRAPVPESTGRSGLRF